MRNPSSAAGLPAAEFFRRLPWIVILPHPLQNRGALRTSIRLRRSAARQVGGPTLFARFGIPQLLLPGAILRSCYGEAGNDWSERESRADCAVGNSRYVH